MRDLYVRTASGGTGPQVQIQDLGIIIPTSATWTLLNAANPGSAMGADGIFTARELRDSQDLFDAITGGTLEWSRDGLSVQLAADYVADYALIQNFVDDELDLTSGGLILPTAADTSSLQEGEIKFNSNEQLLYLGTNTGVEVIEMGSKPLVVLIDEVPQSKYTYVGEAVPGTSVTASGWRIYRLDESSAGDEELIKLYANNSTNFDQVWNDRLSLSYTL